MLTRLLIALLFLFGVFSFAQEPEKSKDTPVTKSIQDLPINIGRPGPKFYEMVGRQSNVVGTWKLVSAKQFNADGTTVPEFGDHPSGFLTYTADGHMHAILTNGARPPLSVNDRIGAPEAERAQAFATGFAYAGTYTISAGKVTHHVLIATVPNWVGQDFVRSFRLDGAKLIIVTEGAMVNQGVKVDRVELVWQRDSLSR